MEILNLGHRIYHLSKGDLSKFILFLLGTVLLIFIIYFISEDYTRMRWEKAINEGEYWRKKIEKLNETLPN